MLDILRLDPQTDPAPAPTPEPGETEAGEQLHSRCHPGAGVGALWRGEILGHQGLSWAPWPWSGGRAKPPEGMQGA